MSEILDQRPPAPAEIGYDAATAPGASEEDRAMPKGTIALTDIGAVAGRERLAPKHNARGA